MEQPESVEPTSCGAYLKKYLAYGAFKTVRKADKPTTGFEGWINRRFPKFYHTVLWERPRWLALLIPVSLFLLAWIVVQLVGDNEYFQYFTDSYVSKDNKETPRYFMMITMVLGSMIAGATSEGGASVAFPVMTLVFEINPSIARDFSLMIQSYGMTASSISIIYYRTKLEQHSVLYCTLGGLFGMVLGLEKIAPSLTPPVKKMFFVSAWLSFATSLFLINRIRDRKTFISIPNFKAWKAIVLFVFGFIGGILSAIAGSGIDIASFAALTLLFRVSEKVATPTSIVLMAINTLWGYFYKSYFLGGMEAEAWPFLLVCIPIVIFGAPIGSFASTIVHRLVLAAFVYFTDTLQFVSAVIIVDQTRETIMVTVITLVVGSILFLTITYFGELVLRREGSQPDTAAVQEAFTEGDKYLARNQHIRVDGEEKNIELVDLDVFMNTQLGADSDMNTTNLAGQEGDSPAGLGVEIEDLTGSTSTDPIGPRTLADVYNADHPESGLPVTLHRAITNPITILLVFWGVPFVMLLTSTHYEWGGFVAPE